MTTETGTFTPTDEDVERAARADYEVQDPGDSWDDLTPSFQAYCMRRMGSVLATIGPIIERERRAAQVQALREAAELLGPAEPRLQSTDYIYRGWLIRRAEDYERDA